VSCACGVVHPFSNKPEPLSDVRRPDARSAQIASPDGVTRCFHVSVYKVEPAEAVLARNLFSKDDCRLADADEMEPRRPQVPLVSKSAAFACRAERLARARSSPDWPVIGPSCPSERVGPDADSGEEVALGVPGKFTWKDIFDAPFIHVAGRYVAGLDEFAQPCGREWIVFVVIGCHHDPIGGT
jgi:hypothetical protein